MALSSASLGSPEASSKNERVAQVRYKTDHTEDKNFLRPLEIPFVKATLKFPHTLYSQEAPCTSNAEKQQV